MTSRSPLLKEILTSLFPQHEMHAVLYPVFVHIFLELVWKGFAHDGTQLAVAGWLDMHLHSHLLIHALLIASLFISIALILLFFSFFIFPVSFFLILL